MFSAHARWLLLAGIGSFSLLACSSDPDPSPGGAGSPSGGSAGSGQTGGGAAGSGTAGMTSGGSGGSTGTAGKSGGGAGGSASGASSGGTGGAGGGAGGGGGSGGAGMPTAVANITGVNGMTVTGTATFTQGPTMTKVVINLTACPNGEHSSHLHLMKDCGMNGNAAGNHWSPQGEMLGNYTCANNMGMHEVSKPTTTWTVGGDAATDVTKYSFMVHAAGDPNSGDRIGCGVINEQ